MKHKPGTICFIEDAGFVTITHPDGAKTPCLLDVVIAGLGSFESFVASCVFELVGGYTIEIPETAEMRV